MGSSKVDLDLLRQRAIKQDSEVREITHKGVTRVVPSWEHEDLVKSIIDRELREEELGQLALKILQEQPSVLAKAEKKCLRRRGDFFYDAWLWMIQNNTAEEIIEAWKQRKLRGKEGILDQSQMRRTQPFTIVHKYG